MDVLCVGHLDADILVRPVEKVDFSIDTNPVETVELKNGGDGMNTAISLAKLGRKVGFVGKVGKDYFGEYLTQVILDHGIDARGLKVTDKVGTCTSVALINKSGDRTFLYFGGANEWFCFEDIDLSLMDPVRIVHVGGTFALPRFDGEGTAKLFAEAKARGKMTSMDVTCDTTGRWLEIIQPALPYLDLFMPSYQEARPISGKDDPVEIAQFFQDQGVGTVVVKLGSKGCYVKPKDQGGFFVPSWKVRVVDTTGAGDAFVAGFLCGVLQDWPLEKCALLATAVAAMNIEKLGATAGVPDFNGAMTFINQSGSTTD